MIIYAMTLIIILSLRHILRATFHVFFFSRVAQASAYSISFLINFQALTSNYTCY